MENLNGSQSATNWTVTSTAEQQKEIRDNMNLYKISVLTSLRKTLRKRYPENTKLKETVDEVLSKIIKEL